MNVNGRFLRRMKREEEEDGHYHEERKSAHKLQLTCL
jgi:hypothetical protein